MPKNRHWALSVSVAVTAALLASPTAPANATRATTDLTVDSPERIVVNQAYEFVPWTIGGPEVDQLDSTTVNLENAATRENVDLDFYQAPDPPSGTFKVYDWDFSPGKHKVWLEDPVDANYNSLTATPDYITIKFGSRAHLRLTHSGEATTFHLRGSHWSGVEDAWLPSHSIVRLQQWIGGSWVTVAHHRLVHGKWTWGVVESLHHPNVYYRSKLVETPHVWGSHSHAKLDPRV